MFINSKRKYFILRILPVFCLALLAACSFPAFNRPTAEPTQSGPVTLPTQALVAAPTGTSIPLPPAFVESSPAPGSVVALDAPITLVFNQAMERTSVEAALTGSPTLAGRFNWIDDRTLTFIPDAPFLPDSSMDLTVQTSARSQLGLTLANPVSLSFHTAGYLQVAQKLPEASAVDVNPDSAVAVTFNQPVVPLGADPASLLPAFTLEPATTGRGEWINTSTYVFYPDPQITGGVQYTARLDPGLRSTDGGPLQTAEEWSFTAALPRLDEIEPGEGAVGVRLDSPVHLKFNQRMQPESLQASFALLDASQQPVEGATAWNETFTEFTFTPTILLKRDSPYTILLSQQVLNGGGIPLVVPTRTSWNTEPALNITPIQPQSQGNIGVYDGLKLGISASLPDQDLHPYFNFIPAITNLNYYFDEASRELYLYGDFTADTSYVLIVSKSLPDAWGGVLGSDYLLSFHTDPLPPSLVFASGNPVQFLTPEDTFIPAQAANLRGLYLYRGNVRLADFISLSGSQGYTFSETYRPNNEASWFTTLYASPQRMQPVNIPLSSDGTALSPGLYFLRFDQSAVGYASPLTLVVSNIHLTLKLSASDAFIWAVDLRTGSPVPSLSVSVFDENGTPLATGLTNADGVFHSPVSAQGDPYRMFYAIAEQPGDELFGLTLLNWSEGINPDAFGLPSSFQASALKTYVYTDRPIYRPGQVVYFRVVARQVQKDQYFLPSQATLPVSIYDGSGARLKDFDLPLSAYGSVHGEYTLVPETAPGYYRLESGDTSIYFQVAAYRKPEIDVQVTFARDALQLGESLSAQVQAKYFFGAPAGDVALDWALYQAPSSFDIPNYQVGPETYGWMDYFQFPIFTGFLGETVAHGSGKTDSGGMFTIDLPTSQADDSTLRPVGLRIYTLEVTTVDESGQPVSARLAIQVHPAPFYIGLKPDAWVGQAGSDMGFDVITVGWDKLPAGDHTLHGEFRKVTWQQQEPAPGGTGLPTFVPQYTPVSSVDFFTSPDGLARLAFNPPEPGTYQLEVSGEGALTQVTLWVGGLGQAIWPNTPNQRLRLTADRTTYLPGQEAQVFIPNPFGKEMDALVTVERGTVLRYQVIRLAASGSTFSLPLDSKDAPNIYISTLLIGRSQEGRPDFRLGMIELPVAPLEQTLSVTLTPQPEKAGPGEQVSFGVRVTDAQGNPVQGEFSLALVDKAVLALADPNAPSILDAFYGQQPVSVRTGLALAGYALRNVRLPLGLGGGGETAPASVREKFPDTAFWSAEIITDANGQATVTLTLPDSLTTWVADLRGLTVDTRVGQAVVQVVTSKDLIIRPVTPRFLVVGDHAVLAAVVQNNTASDLLVDVSLQATGFLLDEGQAASAQQVNVPAGGRARVEWQGTAQDVTSTDLVFAASSGALQDAARPALGALPVLRYTAPQAFATSGMLESAGQQLELVSLPASFAASGAGELRLELAPSLVASMQTALDVLESFPYACSEQVLSRFLPNLEVYQAMQALNINAPDLKARLDRTLSEGLNTLQARQNSDGGWSWWAGEQSDPFITAYALFGLQRAQAAGISLNPDVLQRAADYLVASMPTPEMTPEGWQLDRLVFEQFALAQAGMGDPAGTEALFNLRDRLSPWAQAMLSLTLEIMSPGSAEAQLLVSDLQATAERTGSGAFWEDRNGGWSNMSSTLSTTAIVVYALAQREPASALLPEAVRYLMLNRQVSGAWNSTYETAWVLMGLTEYVKGTGELSGDFTFEAVLNGVSLASGQAGGDARLNTVQASVPANQLYPDSPNALAIQRAEGPGRLYYTAVLDVALPVEAAAPLNRGLVLSRVYFPRTPACQVERCAPVTTIPAGQQVTAALTLVVPKDAYYVLVEDFIPAGTEILDTSLKTSQLGVPAGLGEPGMEPAAEPGPLFDPAQPFAQGWGWWLFSSPQIFDDHIAWSAKFLPAGTYVLKYDLSALLPGDFRVLPARARQFYFPEVQGSSAGAVFSVVP